MTEQSGRRENEGGGEWNSQIADQGPPLDILADTVLRRKPVW